MFRHTQGYSHHNYRRIFSVSASVLEGVVGGGGGGGSGGDGRRDNMVRNNMG